MSKFGHVLPDELADGTIDQTLDFAKHADSAGLHSIWKQEASGTDAVAVLGAVAQCPPDIQIGTSVASVYSRSPRLLGMAATTLDDLSNNRAQY